MPTFTFEEYKRRQAILMAVLADKGLDGLVISAPENIYYICGYHTKAVFTLQFALMLRSGEIHLFSRQMEIQNVKAASTAGALSGYSIYQDDQDPLVEAQAFVSRHIPGAATIGIEFNSWCMPTTRASALQEACPNAQLVDASGLIDRQRLVKSSAEIAALKRAARAGNEIADKVVAATVAGATERELCAIALRELALSGSEYPGSWPNVMVGERTGLIHAAWGDFALANNDHAIMEITGVSERYHAPSARTVFVGTPSDELCRLAEVIEAAQKSAAAALSEGRPLSDLYEAASDKLGDVSDLAQFSRRCGYSLGIGFPPSWGAQWQIGLNAQCDVKAQVGMAFHVVVVGHRPDGRALISGETIVLGPQGPEALTRGGVFHNR